MRRSQGPHTVEPSRRAPVVGECDVLVIGGGPAGVAAAVGAARCGASVILVERYGHLGGLASGGMVLVLDDLTDPSDHVVTVTGVMQEYIDRLEAVGLAVTPPPQDWGRSVESWQRWGRWGTFDFRSGGRRKTITYAASFDPDGWKTVSDDLVSEAGVSLRLHSWFSTPILDGGRVAGAVCETKAGREALLARVVVDATGDLDVGARAGAEYVEGRYMVTPVFRLGGVDTTAAELFEHEEPRKAAAVNRRAKQILGGAWDLWWMRTPLPGVVWCNCPHLSDVDAISTEGLTLTTVQGRRRMLELVDYVKEAWPGFEQCYIVDVAPQIGVRQTRLLRGEYVVSKDDILQCRQFPDSVARGRDYFTPYRALVPAEVDGLLVAGRHYSASPEAQRIAREIGPCMAMGQAAGVAAALSVSAGVLPRNVDVSRVQSLLIEQGADPGCRSGSPGVVAGSVSY